MDNDPDHQIGLFGLVRASNGRLNDVCDVLPDYVMQRITPVYGDLDDWGSLQRVFKGKQFDEVYHLAAQSHPPTSFVDPDGTFRTNALGTVGLLTMIGRYCPECKVLNCSTSEVYGDVAENRQPITEDYPIAPVNPYGVSKAAADMYATERAHSAGLRVFNTRAFSHTGPRRGHTFSISGDAYQLVRIKKGLQKPVVRVGTLASKRVVMDVRDCVRAYVALMEKGVPGESYNVGGDVLDTMGGYLNHMVSIMKLDVGIEVYKPFVRPIDIAAQIPDSNKCRKLTGWKPVIPIETTLRDLLAYWDNKIKE